MKKTLFFLGFLISGAFSYGQESVNEVRTAFREKYNIKPHISYHLDSNDLTSVFIPFYGKEGAYFVDYFGNKKGKEVYDDIRMIDYYPFYWGKKGEEYFLYRFPEKRVFKRGFDRAWAFGSMDFMDTYYISPRGFDYEKIIFTASNEGNVDNVVKAQTISYHGNFDEGFDVHAQDLYPLILAKDGNTKTLMAINGAKIYECTRCDIASIFNQKRFVEVDDKTGAKRIFDVEKQVFLDGVYSQIRRSSKPKNMFCAFQGADQNHVTFFNDQGEKTYVTDVKSFSGIRGYIYYITTPDKYLVVNVATGKVISSSDTPITQKRINGWLYTFDEERNQFYIDEDTKLEEIIAMDSGKSTYVRVPKEKETSINRSLTFVKDGTRYFVGRKEKFGWVRPDGSWVVEPKYSKIQVFGDDGYYVASRRIGNGNEHALLRFPEEVVLPFEKRDLNVKWNSPFYSRCLVIKDFDSEIGVNSAFEVMYDPNGIFIAPDDFACSDAEEAEIENFKENEMIHPFILVGNMIHTCVFDSKGNFRYRMTGNATNMTMNFAFEEKERNYRLPILPLGQIKGPRRNDITLFRLEDGFVFREE